MPQIHSEHTANVAVWCAHLQSLQVYWDVYFLCAEDIFSRQFPCLGNHLRSGPTYEAVYFSRLFSRFCALEWPLHAWQLACAQKIFSVHCILSSPGSLLTCILKHYHAHTHERKVLAHFHGCRSSRGTRFRGSSDAVICSGFCLSLLSTLSLLKLLE